jgi:hypothetical protein
VKILYIISIPIAEPRIYLQAISLRTTVCGGAGFYLLLLGAFLRRTP